MAPLLQMGISVALTCSPGYFIDGTTGECRQCADGTYQPHPSQVNISSIQQGVTDKINVNDVCLVITYILVCL